MRVSLPYSPPFQSYTNYGPPSSSFTYSWSLSILFPFLLYYFAISMAKFLVGKVESDLKALWVVAAENKAV